MLSRRNLTFAALIWLAFVVYGSLIPFAYAPQPFEVAWANFHRLPWLAIGPEGRADWLANLFLYAPLAYLWMGALDARATLGRVLASSLLVIGALAALAVGIEFLQLYFPPRTVSVNDVLAEVIGAVLGAVLWPLTRTRTLGMRHRVSLGGQPAMQAMVGVYALAYLALALFPMDFVLGGDELAQRLAGPQVSWWLAPTFFADPLRGIAQLLGEAILVAPLGIAVAVSRPGQLFPLAAVAALAGPGIEIAQLFLASGVSQGASAIARVAGVLLGAGGAFRTRLLWESFRRWRHNGRVTAALVVVYVGLVVLLLGAFRGQTISLSGAVERLATIPMLPLYNYYYTSETHAMGSVLAQVALFAPLGILFGFDSGASSRTAMLRAGFAAGFIALAVQVIRLFHPPQRPDLTDVLIAAIAGVAACRLVRFIRWSLAAPALPLVETSTQLAGERIDAPRDRAHLRLRDVSSPHPVGGRVALAVLALLLIWYVHDYPLNRQVMLLGLIGYAGVLLRWPHAWLLALPAGLPLLDFSGYSGRFYWTEFDCAATVTLLVVCWKVAASRDGELAGPLPRGLALLLVLSFAIGLVRGVLPLQALDANAFANYFSHYNALRIAKGAVWAVLVMWLTRRQRIPRQIRDSMVARGLALGAACAAGVVLWERHAFSGLADFADEYRVTGPFWEMNTGGATIEGYFVAALPFVVYVIVSARSALLRVGAVAAFAAVVYSVLLTLSRNGVAALAVLLLVLAVGLTLHFDVVRGKRVAGILIAVGILVVAGIVALPVLTGPALQARTGNIARDLDVRTAHWSESLRVRDPTWTVELLGMGLGRFPEVFYWAGGENRSATYRFLDVNGTRFLRLAGGTPLYLEQIVPIEPNSRYDLVVWARSKVDSARLAIPVCEKWLLTSVSCKWNNVAFTSASDSFEKHVFTIDSGMLASGPWYSRRPVRLSLYNAVANTAIDVAKVQLIGHDGKDLILNGAFAHGMDRWYFSTDEHLPWHVKNLAVQVLFDQGWLGLIAWGGLVLAAILRAASGAASGDLLAATVLASIAGLLVVGVFDSVIDGPRMLLLFCLLLWLAFGLDSYRVSRACATRR